MGIAGGEADPGMALPAGTPSSRGDQAASAAADTSQYVEFGIAERRYAFPIALIREIVEPGGVTPLPHVQACVDGIRNLRGAIIPIIDLRTLMGLPRKSIDVDSRTIVLQVGDRRMGCVVDNVSQVVRIADGDVGPAPDTITASAPYVIGFAKYHDRLLILLDVEELFHSRSLVRPPTS